MNLFALGTCRVHNPLQALRGTPGFTYAPDALKLRFSYYQHTSAEIVQYLRMLRGETVIAADLQKFAVHLGEFAAPPAAADVLGAADACLVEISTDKVYRAGDIAIQIDELARFTQHADTAAIGRWRTSVERGEPSGETAPAAIAAIEAVRGALGEEERWLIANMRLELQTEEALRRDLADIAALAGAPVKVVTHIDLAGSDGRPIAARAVTIGKVAAAAEATGLPVFQPSTLVARHGQRALMMHDGTDAYHYAPDMLPAVGAALAAFARGR